MNYEEAVNLLTSQAKFQIKLGLERIKTVLELFDNPQNKIKIIHIAGTNGKGSVCSILANILKYAGYKTGLYTSPHLVEYTERLKINNVNITKEKFAYYIEKVCNTAETHNIDLTEFEILTVCAFLYFYNQRVDIAIIETGMGGRFDATNTADNPLFEIITSISKDHTDRLGDTVDKIAFEKAGIIKKNSDVIISKNNQGFETIQQYAVNQNANIINVINDIKTTFENKQNYILYNNSKYKFGLLGTYQNQNSALVFAAVELLNKKGFKITQDNLKQGLKTVNWAARLQYIKEKNLIIDGAHNPDAAVELKKSLDLYFPSPTSNTQYRRTFIYSTLNTKDYISIAKTLFNKNDIIYYFEFNHKNAVTFEEYKKNVNWLNIKKIETAQINDILKEPSLKIICGSLYMIGQLYYNIPGLFI